jgi:hypothetical protein
MKLEDISQRKRNIRKEKNQRFETVGLGILDLYNGINEMKYGYQPRTKLVKDTMDIYLQIPTFGKDKKKCFLVTKFG